jgi:hypothetical protein
MCDLNKVSGFLIAAKAAFIAILIVLGVAMANSSTIFAAAANIGLMVGVIAGAAISVAMYAAAIAELDKCTGVCASETAKLREALVSLAAMMGIFAGLLIGLAVTAAIPLAGAIVIGAFLAVFAVSMPGLIALSEIATASTIISYNNCRASARTTTISVFVIVISYVAAAAGIAFSVASFTGGKVPLPGAG